MFEPFVGELAGSQVAADDVLTSGVLDIEGGGSFDNTYSILDDHFDETGACFIRNSSIAASLEAALAMLHHIFLIERVMKADFPRRIAV